MERDGQIGEDVKAVSGMVGPDWYVLVCVGMCWYVLVWVMCV